jgi:hypothetical protein
MKGPGSEQELLDAGNDLLDLKADSGHMGA